MEAVQRNIKEVDEKLATYLELKSEALAQEDLKAACEYKEEISKLQKERDQLSRQLRKEAASMIAFEIESLAQGVLPPKTSSTEEELLQVPKKPLPVPPKKKNTPPTQSDIDQVSLDDLDKQIEDILQMVATTSEQQHSGVRTPPIVEPLADSILKIEEASNFEELMSCLDIAWSDLDKLSQKRVKLEHEVTALMSFLEDVGHIIEKTDVTACS